VDDGIVASFLKNDHELVAAELNSFNGKRYAHVRILIPSAIDDEWIHTDKGVAIEVDRVQELKGAVDKLTDVAALEVVLARIPAGREEIWVGVNRFRGNQYAYIRRFYEKDGEWVPSKRGLSVGVHMVDQLVDLVFRLAEAAAA
jgi:hypothetical protein